MKLTALLLSALLLAITPTLNAGTAKLPALSIANFVKYKQSAEQCAKRANDIMQQMNFNPENYGTTVFGYGEQSVISVDCHELPESLFIQIVVAAYKDKVAESVKNYVLDYLRSDSEPPLMMPCPEQIKPR